MSQSVLSRRAFGFIWPIVAQWARLRTGVVNSVKQETGGVYKYQCVARAVLWTHAAHQLLVVRTVSVELICNLLMLQVGLHFWTFIFVDFETHQWCHCYIYFQGCKPTCVLEWDKSALISADFISLVAVRNSCVEVRLFSFHAIHYALMSFIHCHFCVSTNRRVFFLARPVIHRTEKPIQVVLVCKCLWQHVSPVQVQT